ncbi:ATP-binding protein [Streptomyces sp. NPDC058001]|uniref:HAMP domain-containing sensor histidine kinase n=1 Tax=Streptomyces sp. NPDC058001 TaxID=3346300 RepID=UPI0036E85807
MNRALRWARSLPLRSRLAILVAAAVAVAVAAVALVSWFVVQNALVNSLDTALSSNRLGAPAIASRVGPDGTCRRSLANENSTMYGATVQLIGPTGDSCVIIGEHSIQVTSADKEVLDGQLTQSYHNAHGSDGKEYRVLTYTVAGWPGAVSTARPLTEVTGTLSDLTLVLVLVAGIGVLGAGAAGAWVARTGLRPVDQLTGAVEHVARTEDLTVRIPVEGDDEIARLSRSFNAMTAALASSRELQQQLIADAGHELRTPLTSLRTNIELLSRSEDTGRALPPDHRRDLLASVKAQMTELAALIGDLQELSRPDDGQHLGKVQVIGLHEIADVALRRARLRGPEVTITADLQPWYVRGEPAALERAIVNILDNAVKFSPPGGTVEVALREGGLTVRDHGPGIPDEELPHVFDRFWRSPSARGMPGSGLGLSIVARTIQSAGGRVTLDRAEGGGTVAAIHLPGAPTPPPTEPGAP